MTDGGALRAALRPLRRSRRLLATVDPDRARLRLAVTTIVTLVVVAAVLFGGATVAGLPVTAVIPGVVLAMISSIAVREPRPGPRAVTILLLVPASTASVALASALVASPLVADAVFVAVAVAAVFLRALGPRGTALGMLAFISYFLAVFVRITPEQLPVVVIALTVAALLAVGIRSATAPRHPDRDLQRMIAVLGDRAGRVVSALRAGVQEGGLDERLDRTLRTRLAASSSTASSVQDALDSAQPQVVAGIGNDVLGVRVLDFQLTIERLADAVRGLLVDGLTAAERSWLDSALDGFVRATAGPVRLGRAPEDEHPPAPPEHPDVAGRLAQIGRILAFGVDAWTLVASQGPDPADPLDADVDADAAADAPVAEAFDDAASDRRSQLRDITRQAVQVAITAALAIAVGTALSSTRWFWAVITAFVVYVGTSTRGDILSKGWLQVVGTLAGVVVGVIVAALVGGSTILAVVLIAVCLFSGVYLMSVSSAFMIFFVTTMLALLYGLLGQFSVDLLLVRLTETTAGAVIGVTVAYVVLPTSTRDVVRQRMGDFLDALAEAVSHATSRLAEESPSGGDGPVPASTEEARALRRALDALRTAARPITHGFAGVADRSGSRRTLQILGACGHHGATLLRIADNARGSAGTPALQDLVASAGAAVRADIETFASGLGGGLGATTTLRAAPVLDALAAHPDVASSGHRTQLVAAIRDLRAIDQAICDRAVEQGAAPGG